MLQKTRKPPKLFSDFDTLQFASVMAMVVFVILLAFMTDTVPDHGVSVDLPKASNPISMPGVLREDVMQVAVMRDGKVYFGTEQIVPDSLAKKIQARLEDHGVERKIYISADMRARYGTVKAVLDGVRSAGILRVAFLVNQRRLPGSLHSF